MTTAGEKTVRIDTLKKNQPNLVQITATRNVIVYFDVQTIRVVQDLCPHMGGPLSTGSWNFKDRIVRCPWHGYEYCTSTRTFKSNPNEEIWIRPLAPEKVQQYKTPQYRLLDVPFRIADGELRIDVSKMRTFMQDEAE